MVPADRENTPTRRLRRSVRSEVGKVKASIFMAEKQWG
jgi:hypothetical protein